MLGNSGKLIAHLQPVCVRGWVTRAADAAPPRCLHWPRSMIIERQTTYDCAPTLGDDAVLQFTKDGWLSFPAVVAPEVNERCVDFLSTLAAQNAEANGGVNPGHFGPSDVDPVALLGQEWFVDGVLLCPAVIGAVRSLLGACVGLPVLLHNHRVTPENSPAPEQTFHHDGGSQFGEELQYLQVFYCETCTQPCPDSETPRSLVCLLRGPWRRRSAGRDGSHGSHRTLSGHTLEASL